MPRPFEIISPALLNYTVYTNNHYLLKRRKYLLEQELYHDEAINRSTRVHPEVVKFFALWEVYVELPKEDYDKYQEMKNVFVHFFGETYFYEMLDMTFFMHQTCWLKKHHKVDTYGFENVS